MWEYLLQLSEVFGTFGKSGYSQKTPAVIGRRFVVCKGMPLLSLFHMNDPSARQINPMPGSGL